MKRSVAVVAFVVAWLVALVVLAPMRWLGELDLWQNAGLSASGATGTVWDGRLLGLAAGSQTLGDVDAGLSAGALLTGTVALEFSGGGRRGELLLGREQGLRAASGESQLTLKTSDGTLQLSLSLDDASAIFRGDNCAEAGGKLDAVITLPGAGSQKPRLALSGSPICREGVFEARLLPTPESPAVELLVQAKADGRYRLVWLASNPDPALRAVLELAGFIAAADGLSRVDEGWLAGATATQQ